jgi:hypothetical protein
VGITAWAFEKLAKIEGEVLGEGKGKGAIS